MEGNPLQKGRTIEDHENLRLTRSEKSRCDISRTFMLVTASIFAVSLVLCCIMWFTGLYWALIQYTVTIRNNTEMYNSWVATPLITKNCIYLFNYTNIPEFMSKQDSKIKVERVGPFCFREQPLKNNVEFKSGGLVEYDDSRTLKFWPEESKASMNGTIVVPNISLLSTITLSADFIPYIQNLILSIIPKDSKSMSPFLAVKIEDFIYGYNDDVLNAVSSAGGIFGFRLPFNRSGVIPWLMGFMNVKMTAETGTRNTQRIGKIKMINGEPKLRLWTKKECNEFQGSDGIYFPPNDVRQNAPIAFYYTLLCRSVYFKKTADVEFQEGLMIPRYTMDSNQFIAPARNPANDCYCRPRGYCYNDTEGLAPVDLKPCLGIPLLMTSPNMNLYSKDKLLSHLEGIELNVTNPDDYSTYFDVVPNVGITVRYMQNVQINLRVRGTKQFENVLHHLSNDKLLPMYYFKRTGDDLPKHNFKLMYRTQVEAVDAEFMFKWIFLSVAFLSGVISAFLISRSRLNNHESKSSLK